MACGGADLGSDPPRISGRHRHHQLLRRFGRARRGRVHDHAPCGRWQTSTFLAALLVTGLTAPGALRRRDRWRELPGLHRTDLGADPAPRRPRHRRQPRRTQGRRYPASHPDCLGHALVSAALSPGPQSDRAVLREAEGSGPHRLLSQHRDALAVPWRVPGALESGRMPQLLSTLRLRRCHTVMKSALGVLSDDEVRAVEAGSERAPNVLAQDADRD